MVTLNHVTHKPIGSNAPTLAQTIGEVYQPAQQMKTMMMRLWTVTDCEHFPTACLLPRVSRTSRDTTTRSFSATSMSLRLSLQVSHLCHSGTTRLWNRSLLHIEMEPSLWFGFATSHGRIRLKQVHGRLLLSLCNWAAYMAIKASLT